MHRRKDIVDKFSGLKFDAMLGDYSKLDPEVISDFFTAMAEDITKERARIGGDWVVAFAVPDIASRNFLRKLLGPDLVFVVLELTPELQVIILLDHST